MKKITNLFLLETKRFFSRKNIFTIIVCLVATAALFYFRYESEYEKYPQYDREDIDLFLERNKVHSQDYADKIKAIQYDLDSKKGGADPDTKAEEQELQQYQRMADAWKNYQQCIVKGWYYEDKEPRDEAKAIELYTRADYFLESYEDVSAELDEQGIYKHTHKDWEKRMALHKAYEKHDKVEPLCHYIPTGSYSVISLFDGKGLVFFAVLCMIFFLNYDAWCKEFEDGSYVITFTLSYGRIQISLARWIIRIIFTYLVMLLLAGELMLLGTHKHGTGLSDYISILTAGKYVAITQATYLKSALVYIFAVIVFVVTFILLISVLLKDSVNTLGVFFFFNCLYLVSSDLVNTKYNPIGLLRVGDIVTREAPVTMGPAMIFCFVYTIVAFIIMSLVLVYRED